MNKKPGFFIIILLCLSSILSFANNPSEESTLIDIGSNDAMTYAEEESKEASAEIKVKDPMVESNVQPETNKESQSLLKQKDKKRVFIDGSKKIEALGNIPDYARRTDSSEQSFKEPGLETSNVSHFSLLSLKAGTVLRAVIEGDVIAYEKSESPVLAVVTYPEQYKRAKLLGKANLDTETKRVNVEFHTMVLASDTTPYTIKGLTSDRDGKLGLGGIHQTDFWQWLWAEVLVRSSGGFLEASTEKEHSIFGSSTAVTPENAAKKGVSTGLSTVADRFGEKRARASEQTEVRGPTAVNIFISQ